MEENRRRFLRTAMVLGTASFAVGGSALFAAEPSERGEAAEGARKSEEEEGISAAEDLMREHGLLSRVLLLYEEGIRRLRSGGMVAPEFFREPASIVRSFVEEYHEKLEEDHVFPEFKTGPLADLAHVLREQHEAGRSLTARILANSERLGDEAARSELVSACEAFIRMYRPHKAREDTVLFPALHTVLSAGKLDELGDAFEAEEQRRFGEGGFEKTVERVAALERQAGIYELAGFTPKAAAPR